MKSVIAGAAVTAAPQTPIGVLRAEVLALIVGNPLFRDAEQLRANHNVHACDNLATLIKWLANVREEAETRAAVERALQDTLATPRQRAELKSLIWEQDLDVPARHRLFELALAPTLTREAADKLRAEWQAIVDNPSLFATPWQVAHITRFAQRSEVSRMDRTQISLVLPLLSQTAAHRYMGQVNERFYHLDNLRRRRLDTPALARAAQRFSGAAQASLAGCVGQWAAVLNGEYLTYFIN